MIDNTRTACSRMLNWWKKHIHPQLFASLLLCLAFIGVITWSAPLVNAMDDSDVPTAAVVPTDIPVEMLNLKSDESQPVDTSQMSASISAPAEQPTPTRTPLPDYMTQTGHLMDGVVIGTMLVMVIVLLGALGTLRTKKDKAG